MVRDQLLNKNQPTDRQNLVMNILQQNDEIPKIANLKQGDTTMNTTLENLNKSI